MKNSDQTINIAFSSAWKSIHPGLQSTFVADMVLSNQFEPLLGYNESGLFVPLGAESWTINDNFTEFTFKINTNRKFSDGSNLSSHDYKRSWEESLKLTPKSTNNSLLDVLYKIEGFEKYKSSHEISGIVIVDNSTLKIKFKSPFRMALEHLTGSRFAAYKIVDDSFIGTGAFVIHEESEKLLYLTPNTYYSPRIHNNIKLSWDSIENLQNKFTNGEIDVIHQTSGQGINEDFFSYPNTVMMIGSESRHWVIELNKTTIFSKKENRQALQFILYNYFKKYNNSTIRDKLVTLDSQFFLPFQKGRLSQFDVDAIIEKHGDHVSQFLSELNTTDGLLLIQVPMYSITKIMEDLKIPISKKSYEIDIKLNAETRHKNSEYDLFPTAISVVSGDPDGLYHVFGKNGAIASKYSTDEQVSAALETGRTIISSDNLDDYYKDISRLILEQVPMIHLGFTKSISFYRSDKIKVRDYVIKRNDGNLDIYERKSFY